MDRLIKIHVYLAFNHTVIQLAAARGRTPKQILKAVIRADDVIAEAVTLRKGSAKRTRQRLRLLFAEHTLSIRRVSQYNTASSLRELRRKIRDIGLYDMNPPGHAGFCRIFTRQAHCLRIDIGGECLKGRVAPYLGGRVAPRLIEQPVLKAPPPLRGKTPRY